MAHPLLSDPFVAAQIDDAVAPFVPRLPADELAWLRDQLALFLQTDAEAALLLQGAHPRNLDASGERGPLGIDDPVSERDPAVGHGSS